MGKLYTANNDNSWGFSYDVSIGKPMDTRDVVERFADLTNPEIWEVGGNYVCYTGMAVACADTGKIYVYKGGATENDIKNSNNWVLQGGTPADGVTITAVDDALSVNYNDTLTVSADNKLSVNIGSGLEFGDQDSDAHGLRVATGAGVKLDDDGLVTLNLGSGVIIDKNDGNKLVVNVGSGVTVDKDNKKVIVATGAGVKLDDNGKVAVNIGAGLSIDSDGKLQATNSGSTVKVDNKTITIGSQTNEISVILKPKGGLTSTTTGLAVDENFIPKCNFSNHFGSGDSIKDLIGATDDSNIKIDGSWDLNNLYIYGGNDINPGPRMIYFDDLNADTSKHWPVSGAVSGYIILDKGHNKTDGATTTLHSQALYIINGAGSDYKIYNRTCRTGINCDDTVVATDWTPWKEVQGLTILQGSKNGVNTAVDLDAVVDNGMYGGVYQISDNVSPGRDAQGNPTITGEIEAFTMIVVNNYAMTESFNSQLSVYNMYLPKQVVQYKISSPLYKTPMADNSSIDDLDPNLYKGKTEMRTGVYNASSNTYKFTEWEPIGGSIIIG